MLTRALTVHTRDDIVRLNYASRFVCVIYTSQIVSIKLGTVRPSVVVDWQYTNVKTVQLQWGHPHSSRCCFLAVLPALVQTMLSGGVTRTRSDAAICASPSGDARMSLGVATPLSAKFFEIMLSTPAWILFWRCHPHAPPFPSSSGRALRTHASNVASRASVSLRFLALLLAGALTVFLTRRDVAFPTSVTVHSIASIVEPGLEGGPTLALLRTLSQAEFTSPFAILASDGGSKLLVELPHSASLLLPSLLAVVCHDAFHAHVAAVLPANIADLSR